MSNYNYKQYTEEESKIYDQSMDKIMEGLRNGLNFIDACNTVTVEDKDLMGYIEDDALKIIIGEMHYVYQVTLQDIADNLQIPIEKIIKANEEMLEDVAISSVAVYKHSSPDNPFGNA
jgi:hypothetical protein